MPINEDGNVDTDDEIDIDDSNKDGNVNLPGCSFAGNRARSKTDKLAAILAKKTEDRNIIIQSIQQQNEQLINANKNEDETDLFFKSIALSVKKLPTKGINEAKIKTLMLVNELQEKISSPPQITTPGFFPVHNFQQNQQHYYGVSKQQNCISPISYSDSDRSQTSSSAISYPTSINPQTIAPPHHRT